MQQIIFHKVDVSGHLLGKDRLWFFSRKRLSPASRRILGGRVIRLAVVCWGEPVLVQFV